MDFPIFTFAIVGILVAFFKDLIAWIKSVRYSTSVEDANACWTGLIKDVLIWGILLALLASGGLEAIFHSVTRYVYGEFNIDSWRKVDYSFIAIVAAIVIAIILFVDIIGMFTGKRSFKEFLSDFSVSAVGIIILGLLVVGYFEVQDTDNKIISVVVPAVLILLPSLAAFTDKDDSCDEAEEAADEPEDSGSGGASAKQGAESIVEKNAASSSDGTRKIAASGAGAVRGPQYMRMVLANLVWGIIILATLCIVNSLFDNALGRYRLPIAYHFLCCLFCAIPLVYVYEWVFDALVRFCKSKKPLFKK